MSREEILALLDKYLAGDCTEAEKKQVEDWIRSAGRDSHEWAAMSSEAQEKYLKALYTDILYKADIVSPSEGRAGKMMMLPRRRFPLGLVAAVAVLIALSGFLYLYGPGIYNRFTKDSYVTLSALPGKIKKVTLSDGTTVWLNSGSRLRYPGTFKGKVRKVSLTGEAFFDVAKNEQKPFIIRAGQTQTRVLGTSLDVCAYPAETDIQVAVVSGKVEVSLPSSENKAGKMILAANQMAVYTKSTGRLKSENIADAADYAGWRKGVLAFHHTPMPEVTRALQRAYDLKFVIEPAIDQYEISGNFNVHQPVDQVVKVICLSIGAKYKIKGGRVYISQGAR